MMKKSMLIAALAATAVAVAAPSMAGATVQLTENKKPLAVGAEFTLTTTNTAMTFSTGDVTCAKITDHFKVLTNGPKHVEVEVVGKATTEGCLLSGILPVTFTELSLGVKGTIDTWGKVTEVISGTMDIPAVGIECTFEGSLEGQFEEEEGTELDLGPSSVSVSGSGCPTEGVIHGRGGLETSNGVPVELDFQKT